MRSSISYVFIFAAVVYSNLLEPRSSVPIAATATSTSVLHPGPSDASAILYPAIYNTNLTDVTNLDPQVALQVYYEEPGNGTNAAIVAFEDLKNPTVVLEHSSYITNVTCSNGKVTILFSSRSMASYAYSSWSADIVSGIIFVTNHPTCSDAYPAERGWILVSAVKKNGASITCSYVDVMASDIIKTVGIYLGQQGPGGSSSKSQPSVVPTNTSSPGRSTSTKSTSTTTSSSSISLSSTSLTTSTKTPTSASPSKTFSSSVKTTTSSTSFITTTSLSASPSGIPTSTLGYTYVGCFKDSSPHALTKILANNSMDVEVCLSFAKAAVPPYPYAGVEYGRECWAALTSPAAATSTSGKGACTMTCTGNLTEMCGGSGEFNLYHSLATSKTVSSSTVISIAGPSSSPTLSLSTSSKLSTSSSHTSSSSTSSKSSTSSSSLSSSGAKSSSSISSSSGTVSLSSSTPSPNFSSSLSTSHTSSLSSITPSSSSLPSTFSTISSVSSSVKSSSTTHSSSISSSSTSTQVTSSTKLYSSSSSTLPSTSATTAPFVTIADFDTALDDSLGYMSPSSPSFWLSLLPGIPSSQYPTFGTPTSSKRDILRRDWNLVNIAVTLTQALPGPIGLSANTIQAAFASASDAIDAAVSVAIGIVIAQLNALSPLSLGPFPFSAMPNETATTDFGPGVELATKNGTYKSAQGTLSAYCIGCGASGSFSLTGTILFDAQEGITQAVFDVTGSIHAQIEIAVVASITDSAAEEKNLFTQGLPDLTIPGFLVLGPAIALDIGATATVSAIGGLAAGYQLNWPAITAHLDVLNDVYTATGLSPTGSPILDTEANITCTASIYGIITLSFGIDVMGGKYKANVGIADRAEIDAVTEVIVYTDYQISQMDEGAVICVGENFTIGLTDSAYADVVWSGPKNKANTTKTYPLTSLPGPTFTTCFGSLSTIHHTTTSSSSSSSPPSATPTPSPVGNCDPGPLIDGYCCPLPDQWAVSSPSLTAWFHCVNNALNSWNLALGYRCGEANFTKAYIKECYDAVDVILQSGYQPCPTPSNVAVQSYWYYECLEDNGYVDNKRNLISYEVAWGKRDTDELDLVERQNGFVNVVGHGARNETTMLAWADDGNLVASQNGTSFATLNGMVIGDTNNRLLHAYTTTIIESEVSRLRLATLDKMPVGSVLVALAPIEVPTLATPALVAFTSSGAYYYIITCTITGQLPKLFLATQATLGIQLLQGATPAFTGGVVEECGLLPWTI